MLFLGIGNCAIPENPKKTIDYLRSKGHNVIWEESLDTKKINDITDYGIIIVDQSVATANSFKKTTPFPPAEIMNIRVEREIREIYDLLKLSKCRPKLIYIGETKINVFDDLFDTCLIVPFKEGSITELMNPLKKVSQD